jgi:hypothetical protein
MVLSNMHHTGEFVFAYFLRRKANPSRYDAVYGEEYTFGEPCSLKYTTFDEPPGSAAA